MDPVSCAVGAAAGLAAGGLVLAQSWRRYRAASAYHRAALVRLRRLEWPEVVTTRRHASE